jgi:hypothetical protein
MQRYLICDNSKCRFVLDRHINGKSADDAQLILKRCPACGGAWSTSCPSCAQTLSVKLADGLLHSACCDRKPAASARAA